MKHYPLTAAQSEFFREWDMNHNMTQYNMSGYFIMSHACIDWQRFKDAVKKLISLRPYLNNRLIRVPESDVPDLKYYDDPTRCIRQYPDIERNIEVEFRKMTDEELEIYVHTPTKPYNPFIEPMVRFSLIETPTKSVPNLHFFHLLVDGISIKTVNNDLEALYRGESIADEGMEFYELAEKEYESWNSDRYLADLEYYKDKLKDFHGLTDIAHNFDGIPWGKAIFSEKTINYTMVDSWAENHGLTTPDLMMAVFAKTLSQISGQRKVYFQSTSHGRQKKHIVRPIYGNMLRLMVFAIDVDPNEDILALSLRVRKEMFTNLRHQSMPLYHYLVKHDLVKTFFGTEFIYDGRYMEVTCHYDEHIGYWKWFNFGLSMEHLTMLIFQRGPDYTVEIDCSNAIYDKDEIDNFANEYQRILTDIVYDTENKDK